MNTEKQPFIQITVQLGTQRYTAAWLITEEEKAKLAAYLSKENVKGHAEDWTDGLIEAANE